MPCEIERVNTGTVWGEMVGCTRFEEELES